MSFTFEKILNRRGQLGLQRMSPSNARENVFERTPTTKKDESRAQSMIFCDSGHMQNEHQRSDMK